MANRILILLLTAFLIHTPNALAGAGHSHAPPINDEQALDVAAGTIQQLTAKDVGLGFGKLDPSWNALARGAKRIHAKEKRYYIISAQHEKEARTLYIFMSPRGEVYDANFTGKFQGIK
ncbi:MAG: hypothetical protein ACI8PT_001326 [Gammaproteobacteria bacterium]|jgi:hypothetical protein